MSREIKFRLWREETMHYDPPIVLEAWATLNDNLAAYGELDGTIMQYTGLKDKNGVEIYEGDVMRYWSQRRRGGQLYPNNTKRTLRVVTYKVGKRYCGFNVGDRATAEVIGNIYENPELLK